MALLCTLTKVCDSGASQAAIDVGGSALFAKFSRTDEAEADAEGVATTIKAGISPYGIPEMFRILLNERKTNPGALDAFFASHPLEEESHHGDRGPDRHVSGKPAPAVDEGHARVSDVSVVGCSPCHLHRRPRRSEPRHRSLTDKTLEQRDHLGHVFKQHALETCRSSALDIRPAVIDKDDLAW